MDKRQLFLQHVGQTSPLSLSLQVSHAEGMYIYDASGKKYLDLNSGISVSSLGHRHPAVMQRINDQLGKHMHTMVYGEHIQSPQVEFATRISAWLDNGLDAVYFGNAGAEVVEIAMKLARRYTRRYEIISCSRAYHGSTYGAEALRSDHEFTSAFGPGVPGIKHIDFNDEAQLSQINCRTACVILEPVQAEAGVVSPQNDYLKKVRARCTQVGALMVLDEIQTGFGRTGFPFAHKKYNVVPDILLIAKSMGGGMPVGACIAPKHILDIFTAKPVLGHITTFGGHPVCIAAAVGVLDVMEHTDLISTVLQKEVLIKELLKHEIIKEIRSNGLMMAVELTRRKYLKHVVNHTIQSGALIDYFLFNDTSFRLAPPLIISHEQIKEGVAILLEACDFAKNQYRT